MTQLWNVAGLGFTLSTTTFWTLFEMKHGIHCNKFAVMPVLCSLPPLLNMVIIPLNDFTEIKADYINFGGPLQSDAVAVLGNPYYCVHYLGCGLADCVSQGKQLLLISPALKCLDYMAVE